MVVGVVADARAITEAVDDVVDQTVVGRLVVEADRVAVPVAVVEHAAAELKCCRSPRSVEGEREVPSDWATSVAFRPGGRRPVDAELPHCERAPCGPISQRTTATASSRS